MTVSTPNFSKALEMDLNGVSEIVAKALSACVGAIVAVSGPTTLAVDTARRHDLLLVGFARDDRMNIYSGGQWVHS